VIFHSQKKITRKTWRKDEWLTGNSRIDEGGYLGALPGRAGSTDEMVNHKVMEVHHGVGVY
jgi:hypothetical protein